MSASQLPPGPKGLKFVNAMKMGMGAFDYLQENYDKYGDTFTLRFPGMAPFVWMADPKKVQAFFNLKPDEYDAAKLPIPIDVGDSSTGFLNGKEHQHSRKVVIPHLVAKRLHNRAEPMYEIVHRWVNGWKVGDSFDTPREIGDMTLNIAIYTLFGLREDDPRQQQYKDLMLRWIAAATSNTMFTLGTLVGPYRFRNMLHKAYLKKSASGKYGDGNHGLPWTRAIDLKVQLANMMREDIRERRANPDPSRTDMLSMLCASTYENGEPVNEERVIGEAMQTLVGGHETSAATSGWHMLWMVKKPEVFARCREEVLQSIKEEGRFDPLKICELPYCNATLNESMRLTPSAVGTIRYLVKDCQFDDLKIPAGTNVLAGAYLIHRNKEIWGEDALEFRPERWLDGKFQPGPFDFFPFGGGRRACVGANHAKQQLRILWAELYRRCEFDSPYANNDKWPGQQQVSGQTEPMGGVPVTLTTVRPADYGIPQAEQAKEAS